MSRTAALSTASAGAPLTATTIERRELRDDDITIDIAYAGICHSDIHQVREEWGSAIFPMVPGHEIAGVVSSVGDGVTRYRVGDRVGVGCMVDSCGECEFCKDGQEQFCAKGAVMTYNGKGYDGEETMGGYSQQVVVSERFAVRIPDGLELDVAAPLLCAGITTYNPLKRWGAAPGTKVAVVGLGGLGHLGVKFAAALGAEVTVLSQSTAKQADSTRFGAVDHRATKDESTFKDLRGQFDLILNTVSANLPFDDYLLLKPNGAMVNVGAPSDPSSFQAFSLIGGSKVWPARTSAASRRPRRCSTSAPSTASPQRSRRSAPTRLTRPTTASSTRDVRYRFVIDTATIGA